MPPAMIAFSIIVPAHNEERTIARVLSGIGHAPHRQVIVAANGCTDRTAEAARAAAPWARVLDLAEGGKWRAINAALDHAGDGPAIVLDADVEIAAAALDALARVLAEVGVLAASPAAEFDLSGCDALVRAYYRVFARHHYLRSGVGGSGVYGLSAEGRALLGEFPRIISDDGYVRTLFPEDRQRRVSLAADGSAVVARVRPPRTWHELLRSEARWRRGDRELVGVAGDPPRAPGFLLKLVRQREVSLPDAMGYAAIKLMGRLRALAEPVSADRTWHKDASSRG